MTARSTTRRDFLKTSIRATILSGAFVSTSSAAPSRSPNEKLNLAAVGVGNKGWHNIQQLRSENFVALCDVDSRFLGNAADAHPKAKLYRDYRRMLDREQNRIDGVVVSTADHCHAPVTSVALDLGKHVYCEKPLTHTVREARTITELARRRKVATQMGTQIHAGDNYRRVVELIRSGAIGTVREVYNWCNKAWANGRFQKWEGPPPEYLRWDLWLGPAKERPYSPNVHPFNWRRFWEFGSGTFGDMACHIMDLAFWALDLDAPTRVRAKGSPVDPVGCPEWVMAEYEFPAKGDRPAVKFYWSDGGKHFDAVAQLTDYRNGKPLKSWGLGVLFVGDKGMLAANYGDRVLFPKEQYENFEPPPKTIPDSIGHWNEWIQACKTGSPTLCHFGYAGPLTETVLLGTVAYRAGEELHWDAKNLTTGSTRGDELLTKHYRKGFEVVGLR
ncbi:MAG: gfo/Idh/MocA family oxidoreductase [Planctomycetota bacterium]|nr:MAG: gfo/Idh/MocA family oxidoreductase [Planctomycetota bacterium]